MMVNSTPKASNRVVILHSIHMNTSSIAAALINHLWML